jgi:molecular chaperone GrpE
MEKNDQKEEAKLNEQAVAENTEESMETQTETAGQPVDNASLKLQNEISEQKDKYLRLYSEFENFRRRTSKEKLEMIQSANEQLIKALLPVADDFERAEKSFRDKNDKELEGFFLIQNKFRKTLEQYGVKVMTIEPGASFDADVHEAITQIPAPSENLKGKIVEVIEKGYLLNEKVIRFAKVIVGS